MIARSFCLLSVAALVLGSPAQGQAPPAAPAPAPASPAPAATAGTNAVAVPQLPKITGPLVARPPQYARWIVRVEWAEAKPDPAVAKNRPASPMGPKLSEYMKGPNVGRQVTTWSDGGQTTIWFYDRIMMEKLPIDTPICLKELPRTGDVDAAVGDSSTDRFLDRYSDFDWLRPEFFVGEEEKNGLRCLHFKEVVPSAEFEVNLSADDVAHYDELDRIATEEALAAGNKKPRLTPRSAKNKLSMKRMGYEREAWVTVEGRWPVATRLGPVMNVYQHLEPPVPGAFPRMPPEFHTLLVEYCQAWNLPPPKY